MKYTLKELFENNLICYGNKFLPKQDKEYRLKIRDKYADAYPSWEEEERDRDYQNQIKFDREWDSFLDRNNIDRGLPLDYQDINN